MGPLTTFRVGGEAALYLEPESEADLVAAGGAVAETGIDVIVVGKGSNLLVSDSGFAGLVLRLGKTFRWAAREERWISAGAAMPLPALAGVALRHGLTGLEFGVAIPATLGGAVRTNAGAHGREVADVLEHVEVYLLGEQAYATIAREAAGLSYRRSNLPAQAVVVAARMSLEPGTARAIRSGMESARAWRRRTQPLAEPNCGSVFVNPPGRHAAALIEECGMKGRSVGGARVSTKHANFITTALGARAADVASLIEDVQREVEQRTGVLLTREVQLVGEFARAER
jgi:UDP-N-acetylmuramate dehydrogenase